MEGSPIKINFVVLNPLSSLGKSKVNPKKAVGMIPDAAKLILPQNILQKGSLKKYANKTLEIQPAEAQESKANVTFTRLKVDLFK